MVLTAASVEWTVVGSDVEALQLEYTWIKEFDPPFNVQVQGRQVLPVPGDHARRRGAARDRDPQPGIPGAKYFGPYPRVWAVRDTIDLMIKVFPIRTCTDSTYARAQADGSTVLARPDRQVRCAVLGR